MICLAKERVNLFVHNGIESGEPKTCEYKLPDGSVIQLGEELSQTTELLFQPSIIGRPEFLGVHELIYQSIQQCPAPERKELFGNIILSGGVTMVDGFKERVERELQCLAPETVVKVTAPPERKFTSWQGGSLLGTSSSMDDHWILMDDYMEEGSNVWRRCKITA